MVLLNPRICTLSVLFLFLVTRVAAANTTLGPVILPVPPGPYAPALKIQVMVDTSRPDPYTSNEKYRRVVTSVYTPIPKSECSKTCQAQYMPPATAAVYDITLLGSALPLFEQIQLNGICCGYEYMNQTYTHDPHGSPLLIWSPGLKESRLEWAAMAQYVSSYGYEVILVDHPGDGPATVFPDGEVVQSVFANATAQQAVFALNVETQDVLFVLDSYSKGTCGASRRYGFDKKVGVIAHATTAAQAMLNDSLSGHPGRIAGGVNLDGVFDGPVLTEGLGAGEKSFLIWVPPSGPNNITSWNEWWNITDELNAKDWRKELTIANSTQGTFTDFPLLVDISGLRETNPKLFDAALGTINGLRSTSILTNYISAFFDMVLKGEKEPLLSGPSTVYPEVSVVRSST
jgi:hypothetical protein